MLSGTASFTACHGHCPCKPETVFRARGKYDRGGTESPTRAALENRIKSEILSYWTCPRTSGMLFATSCQCLREITMIIQQLEVNIWNFGVQHDFHANDTQCHCKLKSF